MELQTRSKVYTLPSYSLTGDLLGFLRCGLQYRYGTVGQLPSSHPVQLWFGQFIHGVLEEGYRQFDAARRGGKGDAPPWPEPRVAEICDRVEKRLGAQGLFPWSHDLKDLGRMRAQVALNDLAPDLFPLVHQAEVRLTGARRLPVEKIQNNFRNADRYEMVGVVDVLTHMELGSPHLANNRLVRLILDALPENLPPKFEVILDYKGMKRPPFKTSRGPHYWDIYGWQVQTYAHLRDVQDDEDRYPVVAGVLLYLNELFPTWSDVGELLRQSRTGRTDVPVTFDPEAVRVLRTKRARSVAYPPLAPIDFRLKRAVRVVPVDKNSMKEALERFDDVVARIETCHGTERKHGRVIASWERNAMDEGTCAACDSRTWCPDFTTDMRPRVPGVKGWP